MCEKYANNKKVESNYDFIEFNMMIGISNPYYLYFDGMLGRNSYDHKKLLTTITTGELTKF